MGVRGIAIAVLALGIAAGAGPGAHASGAAQATGETGQVVVLSGEDNRLNAYDADTGEKRTLIESAADAPGTGLDINAEICVVPDGVPWKPDGERWFIAGEDTEQNSEPGVIKQGWGLFRLDGTTLDELRATQVGKLVPTSFVTSADNPENYGCGVLPDGRIVTSDVGDQLPTSPATGQLIVWYPDGSEWGAPIGPDRNDFQPVAHCKVDVGIGTAGGIELDGASVLVASNRPNLDTVAPGGIYRYDSATWPAGPAPADGCSRTDSSGAALAAADRVGKSLFIPQSPLVLTPSDIVSSGKGTFYVSSVFTGTIAEFGTDAVFRRFVVASTGQLGGITPFGLSVEPDGTLWIADIGVVGPGPEADAGSVLRVDVPDAPLPGQPVVIDEGLQFPDGIGIVELPASATTPPAATPAPDGTAGGPPAVGGAGRLPATGASRAPLLGGLGVLLALAGSSAIRRLDRPAR